MSSRWDTRSITQGTCSYVSNTKADLYANTTTPLGISQGDRKSRLFGLATLSVKNHETAPLLVQLPLIKENPR